MIQCSWVISMFILYGTKVFNKIIGYFGEECECPNCHKKYKRRLLKSNSWIHIFYIPFLPLGSSYKAICPMCFKQEKLKRKQVRELKKLPDESGQSIDTYIIHHSDDKYEIWVKDMNGKEELCVLNNLNKTQIKNFKKNMGLKNIETKEVE